MLNCVRQEKHFITNEELIKLNRWIFKFLDEWSINFKDDDPWQSWQRILNNFDIIFKNRKKFANNIFELYRKKVYILLLILWIVYLSSQLLNNTL